MCGCIGHVEALSFLLGNPWRGDLPSERTRRDGTLRGGLAAAGMHAEGPQKSAAKQ
ncbi:hypothetical protein Z945_2970 [Sulfitobacter noctilucae]|nr:hypothetical protein Z945_2970 [Sulfitobacter noctilucae]